MTTYFAQNGTVYIDTGDGTETEVLAVQNCTIEVQMEANDLYGWGSIKRVASARHEAKVNVTIEYANILTEDFFKYILDPSAGATGLATGVSIADTTSHHYFKIRAVIPSSDNLYDLDILAEDVYFVNLPFTGELGEWVKMNLEGHGADVVVKQVAHQ